MYCNYRSSGSFFFAGVGWGGVSCNRTYLQMGSLVFNCTLFFWVVCLYLTICRCTRWEISPKEVFEHGSIWKNHIYCFRHLKVVPLFHTYLSWEAMGWCSHGTTSLKSWPILSSFNNLISNMQIIMVKLSIYFNLEHYSLI